MVEAIVRPAGPYSLALSARAAGDATRTFRDRVLVGSARRRRGTRSGRSRTSFRTDAYGSSPRASDVAERLRFCLALDDDHAEFLRRFRSDPLLGRATSHLAGLRPLRVGTVAHALLRALCGQLIQASEARRIERRVIKASTPSLGRFHVSPTTAELGGVLARGAPPAGAPRAPRRDARPPLPVSRPRGTAPPADGGDGSALAPRARPRPVVARRHLARGPRPLGPRARRRPRAREAPRARSAGGGSRGGRRRSCSSRTASGRASPPSTSCRRTRAGSSRSPPRARA